MPLKSRSFTDKLKSKPAITHRIVPTRVYTKGSDNDPTGTGVVGTGIGVVDSGNVDSNNNAISSPPTSLLETSTTAIVDPDSGPVLGVGVDVDVLNINIVVSTIDTIDTCDISDVSSDSGRGKGSGSTSDDSDSTSSGTETNVIVDSSMFAIADVTSVSETVLAPTSIDNNLLSTPTTTTCVTNLSSVTTTSEMNSIVDCTNNSIIDSNTVSVMVKEASCYYNYTF